MGFESVDFYIADTTPPKNPVGGVVVKVTSKDGSLVYGQATTDVHGHAALLLPSGITYQSRFYKFQVGFTNPQLFTVQSAPAINSFDIAANLLTPPVPLDARLCTAFGFFRDTTGAVQSGVDIHFIAKFDPVWLEGAAVLKERIIVRSDEKGYVQVNLIRNGQYDVTIQGEEDVVRCISVPDAPNVNLPDLLFPIISSVVLTPPGPFTVQIGHDVTVDFVIFSSDGVNRGRAHGEVIYAVDDTTVLSWNFSVGGLVLIGLAPGTTFLRISRSDKSIVHIPDLGVQNGVIQVTVIP